MSHAHASPVTQATLEVTPKGKQVALGALAWCAAGLGAGMPFLTLVGAGALALFGAVWAVVLLRRDRLGTQRLAAIPQCPDGEGRHGSASNAARIRMTVGGKRTLDYRLPPALSGIPLSLFPWSVGALDVAVSPCDADASMRTVTLSPRRLGDSFLQGFRARASMAGGLFELGVWLPGRVRVECFPRHVLRESAAGLPTTRSVAHAHPARLLSRRSGFGMDLRELRDHSSGDPFRHIAWGATSRRGKLTTRAFHAELALSVWAFVDVSPSMYWGAPGKTRVDFATATAHSLLATVVRANQRAGVTLFDRDLRLSVSPATGRAQMHRITELLQEAHWLFQEGRTEVTEIELAQLVASWFEAHEESAFDLSLNVEGRPSVLDMARLLSRTRQRLPELMEARGGGAPWVPASDYAPDTHQSLLRAFARYAGIPLPLDPAPPPQGEKVGLVAALEQVLHRRMGPQAIIILSDLHAVDDVEALRRVTLLLTKRKHHVSIFCPSGDGFDGAPPIATSTLHAALTETARMARDARLRRVQAALRVSGVSVLQCGPDDVVGKLLARLRRVA